MLSINVKAETRCVFIIGGTGYTILRPWYVLGRDTDGHMHCYQCTAWQSCFQPPEMAHGA
jgi:hypothetical protein